MKNRWIRLASMLLCVVIAVSAGACVVSESEYNQVAEERKDLKKQLLAAKEENRLLNQAVLEIYQERERVLAEIKQCRSVLEKQKPPAAPSAEDATKDKAEFYEVKPGDTLSGIAKTAGVSMDDLIALNKLNTTTVFVGQKLRLK